MKNITNLQKDTGYTPANQETDSEHVLSPQDKQLIEFQCIYDSILRCMHSPQDMQLIELANGYYHYRQQENLVEQTDNSYAIKINDSLYELYMDDVLIGTFEDPANLPEIPIYEKEIR